ncbi:hypothetical protein ACQR36_17370 [Rhodococcus erythropolis]|nr:hypothetical protein [Rhodococcus erythropolis]MDJ0015055.1 hypothetical protein [Rhodococcus erythropolis]MDJ0105437.1 hypothetical protein [Rhodococcus erythropolis]
MNATAVLDLQVLEEESPLKAEWCCYVPAPLPTLVTCHGCTLTH